MGFLLWSKTMKDILWSEILSVGVKEIDEDHRKMIDLFNVLNQAILSQQPQEYLTAVLEELINCTIWHFSHEERLMIERQYPEYEAHKYEHRDLIAGVKELQHDLLYSGGQLTEEQIQYLERWLTQHILTTDQKLGHWLTDSH
jgi:hemerythrin-like metal-binding protein